MKFKLKELLSDENYEKQKSVLKKKIIDDFNCRNEIVSLENFEGDEYELTLGNLVTLLILFRAFKKEYGIQEYFDDKFIIDVSDLKEQENYFDMLFEEFVHISNIKELALKSLSELAAYSAECLGVYGQSIDLFDIVELMRRNKDFKKEIIDFNFEGMGENLEFEEMNTIIETKSKSMIKYLLEDEKDNCYKSLIKSGSGINPRQFREVLFTIGLKPDGRGHIVDDPVDTSYIKGLTPLNFYIDAIGGRTAQLLNWNNTKESGYLTRKLTMLCIDNYIRNDVDDCGTKQTAVVHINDEKTLSRLIYRYYVNDDGKLEKIKKDDKRLIGKTINLRTPIKCSCKKGICKKCYGDLYKVNKNKNIGVIGVLLLTNTLTQLNLSAKHNIQASPKKIEWGEDFKKYFVIDKNQIYLNDLNILGNFNIIIDDYTENEEVSEEIYQFDKFKIENIDGSIVDIEVPVILKINEDAVDLDSCFDSKEEKFTIKTKNINDSDSIFSYIVENNELTATLERITNLIERNSFIKNHTIDEVLNEFIDAINNSPIYIHYVHLEIILKELCKIKDNNRLLFKESEESPIEDIYRVTEALVKNPSPSKSLGYQEFYKQITQNLETFEKDQYSVYDELMK